MSTIVVYVIIIPQRLLVKVGVKIKVKEWTFKDDPDGVSIAPLLIDEITSDILKELKKYGNETKIAIYEENDETFFSFDGIKTPHKIKASVEWMLENKKRNINPTALVIKKKNATSFFFLVTSITDAVFAREALKAKLVYENPGLGVRIFELSEPIGIATMKRLNIKWRKKQNIIADSIRIMARKNAGEIEVTISGGDDRYYEMLKKNFQFDRSRKIWKGKDEETVKKIALLDSLPDTKSYGKGLYFLCEAEAKKQNLDFRDSDFWRVLYSL